jgi:hypothetical protein
MVLGWLVRRNLSGASRLTKLEVAGLVPNRRRRGPHLREPVAQKLHKDREVEAHGAELSGYGLSEQARARIMVNASRMGMRARSPAKAKGCSEAPILDSK